MAASSGIMMAASMGSSAISGLSGAINQAQAYQSQAKIQAVMTEMNNNLSEFKSKDALQRGVQAVDKHRLNTKALIGAQRVSLAAQGIDIESGSALQIQDTTRYMSDMDAMTIKNNAWREAWGYKMESISASLQGKLASIGSESNARNTLLTGGMDALSYGLRGAYYYANPSGSTQNTNAAFSGAKTYGGDIASSGGLA